MFFRAVSSAIEAGGCVEDYLRAVAQLGRREV
jgi:hypothetical protein